MAFEDDLATAIIAATLGTAVNTDIFLGSKAAIPSKPENVGPYINIVNTGGMRATRTHGGRYPNVSAQLNVRAASWSICKAKAQLLHALLCDMNNVTIGSTYYLWIVAGQEVLDMMQEQVGRPKWGFNLDGRTR